MTLWNDAKKAAKDGIDEAKHALSGIVTTSKDSTLRFQLVMAMLTSGPNLVHAMTNPVAASKEGGAKSSHTHVSVQKREESGASYVIPKEKLREVIPGPALISMSAADAKGYVPKTITKASAQQIS
jgi:hypothetical protein